MEDRSWSQSPIQFVVTGITLLLCYRVITADTQDPKNVSDLYALSRVSRPILLMWTVFWYDNLTVSTTLQLGIWTLWLSITLYTLLSTLNAPKLPKFRLLSELQSGNSSILGIALVATHIPYFAYAFSSHNTLWLYMSLIIITVYLFNYAYLQYFGLRALDPESITPEMIQDSKIQSTFSIYMGISVCVDFMYSVMMAAAFYNYESVTLVLTRLALYHCVWFIPTVRTMYQGMIQWGWKNKALTDLYGYLGLMPENPLLRIYNQISEWPVLRLLTHRSLSGKDAEVVKSLSLQLKQVQEEVNSIRLLHVRPVMTDNSSSSVSGSTPKRSSNSHIYRGRSIFDRYVKDHPELLPGCWISIVDDNPETLRIFRTYQEAGDVHRDHDLWFCSQYLGQKIQIPIVDEIVTCPFGIGEITGNHFLYSYISATISDPRRGSNRSSRIHDARMMIDTGSMICVGTIEALDQFRVVDQRLAGGLGGQVLMTYVDAKIEIYEQNPLRPAVERKQLPPVYIQIAYPEQPKIGEPWILGQSALSLFKHQWVTNTKVEVQYPVSEVTIMQPLIRS